MLKHLKILLYITKLFRLHIIVHIVSCFLTLHFFFFFFFLFCFERFLILYFTLCIDFLSIGCLLSKNSINLYS